MLELAGTTVGKSFVPKLIPLDYCVWLLCTEIDLKVMMDRYLSDRSDESQFFHQEALAAFLKNSPLINARKSSI